MIVINNVNLLSRSLSLSRTRTHLEHSCDTSSRLHETIVQRARSEANIARKSTLCEMRELIVQFLDSRSLKRRARRRARERSLDLVDRRVATKSLSALLTRACDANSTRA